jgi:hypothetical protein
MTPQERQMVDELFGRLATLENAPRDPDAERAVLDGLRRAPNAAYALVQTVLVQDEALKRANDRIEELEGGAPEPQPSGGFLDSMRSALSGQGGGRGSVPNVRPGGERPTWNSGQVMGGGPQAAGAPDPRGGPFAGGGGGSSFLGTAAAAATGVIGGSLLMNGIRGLMGGGGHQQSFGDSASLGNDKSGGPWGGGNDGSSGNLSRDAGINDIGKNSQDNERQNFADNSANQRDDNRDDNYGRDDSRNDYASNDDYGGDDDDYGDDDFDDGGDYA